MALFIQKVICLRYESSIHLSARETHQIHKNRKKKMYQGLYGQITQKFLKGKSFFYHSLSLTTSVSGLGFPQFLKKAYVKFIYSDNHTKFCKISTLLLTGTTQDKGKLEISQNFVAFSEYMNFRRSKQKQCDWFN